MAYYDKNGRITIDEAAANQDIRRLREAAQILKESQASIRSLQRQGSEMQGLTAQAIQEKSMEMEKQLGRMITKLESTADYIQKVVANYRRQDEELKRLIQAQQIMTEAGKTVKTGAGSVQNAGETRQELMSDEVRKSWMADLEKQAEAAAKEAAAKEEAQKAVKSALNGFGSIFKK